jgi:hypothetical protein
MGVNFIYYKGEKRHQLTISIYVIVTCARYILDCLVKYSSYPG